MVWSMGEAHDKLSGHQALFLVLLCFLQHPGQDSPLSPSAYRNTQGNWSISDLRSYIQTDCEWGWIPRQGREQGGQQEPRERGNTDSCRGRKSFPKKRPGRIGNKVDKGQGSRTEEWPKQQCENACGNRAGAWLL